MILAGLAHARKAKPRLRPSRPEGFYIAYRIRAKGIRPFDLASSLQLQKSIVYDVISGRRRSAKIEAEIARILGKPSWNDVVQEARAATGTVKPSRLRQESRRAG